MNGKQVRVKRPPNIDGMDINEYIQNNADPKWHENCNLLIFCDNILKYRIDWRI